MFGNNQSATKLRISGQAVDERSEHREYTQLQVEESVFHIQTERSDSSESTVIEASSDDIFEIELEDGTRFWTTMDRLKEDYLTSATRDSQGVLEFPVSLDLEGPSRGLSGKLILKALKLLRFDAPKGSAKHLAKGLEDRQLKTLKNDEAAKLYRCNTGENFELTACDAYPLIALPAPDKPVLIFLHGTASSTEGSFGKLWNPEQSEIRRELFKPYGDTPDQKNVFALQHRTLTCSPVENALVLAKTLSQLPRETEVHLISHSRGGLVGELLCLIGIQNRDEPFLPDEIKKFPIKDQQALSELNALFKKESATFAVKLFVRVACPARGTSLASDRLDVILSLIFNLVSKVPGLNGVVGTTYDVFAELIMATVKERLEPDTLPGLAAMAWPSPILRFLNRPDLEVDGKLRVISGKAAGQWYTRPLLKLLTHTIFQTDHDWVVDTSSMNGGLLRSPEEADFFLHEGSHISHIDYFSNPTNSKRLLHAFQLDRRSPSQFSPLPRPDRDRPQLDGPPTQTRGEQSFSTDKPKIFLIPGMMGSHLHAGSDRIWLDRKALSKGMLKRLRWSSDEVITAPSVIDEIYAPLIDFLNLNYEVIPLPYDWRKSLRDNADLLAKQIEAKFDQGQSIPKPLRIIAHSTGGLLAQALLSTNQELQARMGYHQQSRLILLGTPLQGTMLIPQILTGHSPLGKQLAFLDFQNFDSEKPQSDMLQQFAEFPGLLELLPSFGDHSFLEDQTWQQLERFELEPKSWSSPSLEALQAANNFRTSLKKLNKDRTVYIAGQALATPFDIHVPQITDSGFPIYYSTGEGDGITPWKSGAAPGLDTWYANVAHGDLARNRSTFSAILDLLQTGRTEKLSSVPAAVRGKSRRFKTPQQAAPLYPYMKDLLHSAIGAFESNEEVAPKIKVKVLHGSLAFSSSPVMVGHYRGDSLLSAEAYLDRILGGRLTTQQRLGIYPGALDTAKVFFNPKGTATQQSNLEGAIVIGLGEVGELSPGKLARAVSRGIREYAVARQGIKTDKSTPSHVGLEPALSKLRLGILLVGTNAGGISIEASVTAILHGIAQASHALRALEATEEMTIEEIELIELYEDLAIQAVHALRRVNHHADLGRLFEIVPLLQSGKGGRKRASSTDYDPWWQRLQILQSPQGRISFNLLTDRAYTKEYIHPSQMPMVDTLIRNAIRGTHSPKAASTLFEMLVPHDLKEYTQDWRDIVLILNKTAAAYPWELMQDRHQDKNGEGSSFTPKPLAIRSGMIRQLQLTNVEERSRPTDNVALVVGDPVSTGFPPLGSAADEAKSVKEKLEQRHYHVVDMNQKSADDILFALFQQDYRIIHMAGHGVYNHPLEDPPTCETCGSKVKDEGINGMVIGKNAFLTAAEIRQMRTTPELVFLNCCHLGNVDRQSPLDQPHKLAATLAEQLFLMGVSAIVVAGWAVQDDAAQTFAETFYEKMLSGFPFGKSVQLARQVTFEEHPNNNTWGAFQCYGDPNFRLTIGPNPKNNSPEPLEFASVSEAVIRLQNLVQSYSDSTTVEQEKKKATLREIDRRLPTDWLTSCELRIALGKAYGELKLFAEAIEHYEAALKDPKGMYTVHTVEQLYNFRARHAAFEAAALRGKAIHEIQSMWSQLDLNHSAQDSNESKQDTNENTRNSNESKRDTNENTRNSNESEQPQNKLREKIQKAVQDFKEALNKIQKGLEQHKQKYDNFVITMGSTSERQSIQASMLKRQIMVSLELGIFQAHFNQLSQEEKSQFSLSSADTEGISNHLEMLGKLYKTSFQTASEVEGKTDPYPLSNWLTAWLLLEFLGKTPPEDWPLDHTIEDYLKMAQDAATNQLQHNQDFWNAVTEVDCELLIHLKNDELTSDSSVQFQLVRRFTSRYQEVKNRFGSLRELDSTIEHIRFMSHVIDVGIHATNDRPALSLRRDALSEIAANLQKMV